jgi:hypothetical protein
MMREPIIHSHITDILGEEHPLAYASVYCCACGEALHASNNECMQTWVEGGTGNYCLRCFAINREVLSDYDALP